MEVMAAMSGSQSHVVIGVDPRRLPALDLGALAGHLSVSVQRGQRAGDFHHG
jgi:hypothetical protein